MNNTITVNLDLSGYTPTELYNLVVLGVISRTEYLAELNVRFDDNVVGE